MADGPVLDARHASHVAASKLDSFDRRVRSATLIGLVVIVALLAALGLFTVAAQARTNRHLLEISQDNQRTLSILGAQTSPSAAAANRQKLISAEGLIVECENNHVDRVVALLTHQPIPALRSGCPADTVNAP